MCERRLQDISVGASSFLIVSGTRRTTNGAKIEVDGTTNVSFLEMWALLIVTQLLILRNMRRRTHPFVDWLLELCATCVFHLES